MITNPKKVQMMNDRKQALEIMQDHLRTFSQYPDLTYLYDAALEMKEIVGRYDERIKAL